MWKKLGDDYIISDEGIIKNIATDRIINPWLNNNSYYYVTLNLEGTRKNYRVHRLVAEKFIPNPNNLPQVNHKDGDKRNNKADNLEWCDSSYNVQHAIRQGLIPLGVNNKRSKLSQEDVDYIKQHCVKRDKEFGCAGLGRRFNVDKKVIYNVIYDKRY